MISFILHLQISLSFYKTFQKGYKLVNFNTITPQYND